MKILELTFVVVEMDLQLTQSFSQLTNPFIYLYRHGSDGCQQVEGMRYRVPVILKMDGFLGMIKVKGIEIQSLESSLMELTTETLELTFVVVEMDFPLTKSFSQLTNPSTSIAMVQMDVSGWQE